MTHSFALHNTSQKAHVMRRCGMNWSTYVISCALEWAIDWIDTLGAMTQLYRLPLENLGIELFELGNIIAEGVAF